MMFSENECVEFIELNDPNKEGSKFFIRKDPQLLELTQNSFSKDADPKEVKNLLILIEQNKKRFSIQA